MTTFTEYFCRHRGDVDAVFFDIDGTLSVCGTPIPGAFELLSMLEKEHFPYLLLTNDSCNSCEEKAEIVRRGGIPASAERIFSSGNMLRDWAEKNYHGELFFQCGRLGIPNYADLAGIRTVQNPSAAPKCTGVIIGEGAYDWRPSMEAVLNLLLQHPEYPMLVANPDSYWSCSESGIGIGSGGQARFLCGILREAGKTVTPVYLGKPYSPIYSGAYRKLRGQYPDCTFTDPGRIMMLGDSLTSDILGANRNGLCSCLVLSGITTIELVEAAPEERKPKMIFTTV